MGGRGARRRGRDALARRRAPCASVDAVVVPGGFAHGDYLRTGAIARFSPVMDAVARVRRRRRPRRRHLQRLPGAHRGGPAPRARCRRTPGSRSCARRSSCEVETHPLGAHRRRRRRATCCAIPINHFEGNYVCDADTLRRLRDEDRVVVRYVDNPNGSLDDIAGISNEARQRRRPHAAPGAGQRRAPRLGRRRRAARSLLASCSGVTAGGAHEPLDDPRFLEHVGRDAELAPRGVGDALALGVLRRRLHEIRLERRQVDLGVRSPPAPSRGPSAPGPAGAVGGPSVAELGVDGAEALLDGIGRAPPAPPRAVLLEASR